MKLRPVTKLDKRNKTTSKKFDVTSCRKIVMSLSFFGFLANLEQSGGRIPDTESAKVMFSVIVTFCLTKTKKLPSDHSDYDFFLLKLLIFRILPILTKSRMKTLIGQ